MSRPDDSSFEPLSIESGGGRAHRGADGGDIEDAACPSYRWTDFFWDFPALPSEEHGRRPFLLASARNLVAFSVAPCFALVTCIDNYSTLFAIYAVLFCYLLIILLGAQRGYEWAKHLVELLGRRAIFEVWALKRVGIPMKFLSGVWLPLIILYGSRNAAFKYHKNIASYALLGSRGRIPVINAALHTHDYVTLRDPDAVSDSYVWTDFGQWNSPAWKNAVLKAGGRAPTSFSGRLQGERSRFYLSDDENWYANRPRPRPLRSGDMVRIMAGNHRLLACAADGSDSLHASVDWPWGDGDITAFYIDAATSGEGGDSGADANVQVKPGSILRLRHKATSRILGIRDGRLACLEDGPTKIRGLIIDNRVGRDVSGPELVVDPSGELRPTDTLRVPLGEALNRTYLAARGVKDATEVELSLQFGKDMISHLEWPRDHPHVILQDVGFMKITPPEVSLSEEVQHIIVGTIPSFVSVLMVSAPWCFGKTTQGWSPGIIVIAFRILRVLSLAYVFRCATFLSTSIPGARVYCQPSWNGGMEDLNHPPNMTSYSLLWDHDNIGRNCGDNIFSGHMTNCMGSFCVVSAYLWATLTPPGASRGLAIVLKLLWLGLTICYVLLILRQGWEIIAVKNHYTVDVVVAFYFVPLVYLLDTHVLVKEDPVAPEHLNIALLLRDFWSWVPLPLGWTAILRSPASRRSVGFDADEAAALARVAPNATGPAVERTGDGCEERSKSQRLRAEV